MNDHDQDFPPGAEMNHVWIHLQHDEMIDIQHLRKAGHRQVAVYRTVNPLVMIVFPGNRIFDHQNRRNKKRFLLGSGSASGHLRYFTYTVDQITVVRWAL